MWEYGRGDEVMPGGVSWGQVSRHPETTESASCHTADVRLRKEGMRKERKGRETGAHGMGT